MLKGIPRILSPELLKVLCEMGHGDCLVLADANFPAASVGKNAIVIRMDGHNIPELLTAILKVLPLDQYVTKAVTRMERCEGDSADISIWKTYDQILSDFDERGASLVRDLERFAFYEEAKKAYVVIATGETSQYANLILQKGCLIGAKE